MHRECCSPPDYQCVDHLWGLLGLEASCLYVRDCREAPRHVLHDLCRSEVTVRLLVGRLEASLHVGLQCCHVRLGARWEVTPEVAALSSLQGVDDADTGDL